MTTNVAPPFSLTILRQGERLFVDLAEVGTLIPRGETRVEETFLREVTEELRLLATPGFGLGETRTGRDAFRARTMPTSSAGIRALERLGGLLFSHLFPEAVQARLRAGAPGNLYLRLDEQLLALPWELAYDGQDFLTTKFAVGRQVITSQPLPRPTVLQGRDRPLKVLLIADPSESLPHVAVEVEQLCAVLEKVPGVDVTLLGGKNVRKTALLAAVQEHTVVHFAGHSVYDPKAPGESGWRLHEGLLTAREVGKLTHPPQLVFSNSCHAGATTGWGSGTPDGNQSFGLGGAFLLAGVPNYIGPCWVVHDGESEHFAAAFYQHLIAGLGLAEALRRARQQVSAQRGAQSLTWASYLLYGDPAFTLLATSHARSLSPVRAEQPQRAQVMQRKLTAILSADVKGYSRLMGDNEEATIRTLTAYREVMTTLIHQHRGRVIDSPGDNLLAEFASAVDAVQGAVAIQRTLKTRNTELPEHRQMQYRIGINVGDVISEGERLYGDGVNIAARLEGIADPGGICIAGTVYDQVKNKVLLEYESLGEQMVKNIADPVRVYRVRWEPREKAELVVATPATIHEVSGDKREDPAHRAGITEQGSNKHPFSPVPLLVGREAELTQIHKLLEKALRGERQLVFVTGEAGIGKTTLIEVFLSEVRSLALQEENQKAKIADQFPNPHSQILNPDPWIAHGQCIEQYGAGEAYMPILEALGRLCREPRGERLLTLLNQHAPTWLVQLPTLLRPPDLEALQRKVQGATRERMLREMAEAMDVITAECPLVLWLEDLHWSDVSTLELLALLARRREPARLLILGTYRPVDVIVNEHPLRAMKQELQLHRQCEELAVRLLAEEAVGEYLAVRIDANAGVQHAAPLLDLARTIHQRTEGNPLFMVNVVDELLTQEIRDLTAIEISTPATIREMIERQLERLGDEEQKVIEAASVAGMEFSAAAVAAGMETTVDEVEQRCTTLARRGQFLQTKGTTDWPDGTVTTRYSFLHALYQEVTYERLPIGRRINLHRRIGERIETAHGKQANEIAAELAVHFAQGQDYPRAVRYAELAGHNALRRNAYPEAIQHFTRGLEFIPRLPDTPERVQQELRLQTALVTPFSATKGYGAPEVERACARARELCKQVGETPQLFATLGGLCSVYHNRAEVTTALTLAEQLLRLAQQTDNPILLVWAYTAVGLNLVATGQLVSARDYLERALSLYDLHKHRNYGFVQDPGVSCFCYQTELLWRMGYPDQAWESSQKALTLARQLSHPYSLALALDYSAMIHWVCGKREVAHEYQAAHYALAHEQGFVWGLTQEKMSRGVDLIRQGHREEGLIHIRQSKTTLRAMGHTMGLLAGAAILAEIYGETGLYTEGLRVVAEALAVVHNSGACDHEPELYRLKGELTLQQENQKFQGKNPKAKIPHSQVEAEECFLKAVTVAQKQQAKSWELRASTSLARLWQRQGKKKEAHKLLADIYGWFTEGFDTKDLQEAKALIEELRH